MPVVKKRKHHLTCGIITACASAFATIVVIFIDLFFPITKEEATIAVSAITTLCVIIATSGLHNFLQAVWEGMNGNGNGNGNGGENV